MGVKMVENSVLQRRCENDASSIETCEISALVLIEF